MLLGTCWRLRTGPAVAAGPVPDPLAAGGSGRAGYLAGGESSADMRSSAAGPSQ